MLVGDLNATVFSVGAVCCNANLPPCFGPYHFFRDLLITRKCFQPVFLVFSKLSFFRQLLHACSLKESGVKKIIAWHGEVIVCVFWSLSPSCYEDELWWSFSGAIVLLTFVLVPPRTARATVRRFIAMDYEPAAQSPDDCI